MSPPSEEVKADIVVDDIEGVKAYVVPKGEENDYHVLVHKGDKFDKNTGKPAGYEYVHKCDPKAYTQLKKFAGQVGLEIVKVLYAPKGK